ncbi:odorant receptor Or1-like [Schistocerca nitens]|uniref:odorant receptor Or1-like n=1 Tax=Schistocerca nitens TaxID=7011 RepID=UPI00211932A3|nr:odorant receptor Or1-like [Schistocerca nitens]
MSVEGAQTWRSTASSVLKYNVRLLFLCGLWPMGQGRLYAVLTTGVLVAATLHAAGAFVGLCSEPGGLQEVTLSLANLFVVCSAIVKSCFFLANRTRFCALVTTLDRLVLESSQRGPVDAALGSRLAASRRRAVRLTLAFHLYVLSALVAWSLMPAIHRQRRLPYQQLRWLDTSSAAVYGASYALQCTATFFCSFINTHLDVFFMAVMIHMADQFRILAARFADLRLDADCNPERRVLQDGSSRLGEELYRELSLCIQNHQDLVRLVHLLDDVMSPIAMTQFVVGAVNACMVLFPATYSTDVGAVLKCWAALPMVGIQIFLYCSGAHDIMEQRCMKGWAKFFSGKSLPTYHRVSSYCIRRYCTSLTSAPNPP